MKKDEDEKRTALRNDLGMAQTPKHTPKQINNEAAQKRLIWIITDLMLLKRERRLRRNILAVYVSGCEGFSSEFPPVCVWCAQKREISVGCRKKSSRCSRESYWNIIWVIVMCVWMVFESHGRLSFELMINCVGWMVWCFLLLREVWSFLDALFLFVCLCEFYSLKKYK